MSDERTDREAHFNDGGCDCRQCIMQRERDEARAALARVEALHIDVVDFTHRPATTVCAYDSEPWPCTTRSALEQP